MSRRIPSMIDAPDEDEPFSPYKKASMLMDPPQSLPRFRQGKCGFCGHAKHPEELCPCGGHKTPHCFACHKLLRQRGMINGIST